MFKAELIERTAQFRRADDDPTRKLESCPALVLNADYTPLSYYPLSLWPWQTAIKAVFLERVDIVASYERQVHSPSLDMKIPSVIALRQYVRPSEFPAFTRFNVFLRDRFCCQYCGSPQNLTFDHVVPRRLGGAHDLGEHHHRLRTVQHAEGRAHAQTGEDEAAARTDPAHELAIAAARQALSAQLPARDLARLAVLGHRARGLIRTGRSGRGLREPWQVEPTGR